MAKNGFKVFDSDMHIMAPPDLWQRYIEPEFRDQAPIGLTSDEVRDLRIAHLDGRQRGYNPARDRIRSVRGKNFERTQTTYRYYSEQGWSAKAQLEAMDVEGIDVAVLYPARGLAALDQLLDVPMRAQVLVEEKVGHHPAEGAVIGDALVQIEVGVDDFLDYLLHLVIEGETDVLPRINPGGGGERRIAVQFRHP